MEHASHDQRSPAQSAGADDQREGTPPLDDLPACLSCRRRKSRCSRESPSCAQCVKIGAECQYVAKHRPGIKTGAVDGLSRRLEVLERILLDSFGNTKAQLAAVLDPDIDQLNGNRHSYSTFTSSSERARSVGQDGSPGFAIQDSPAQNTSQSQIGQHRQKRRRVDNENHCWDVGDDFWMPPLPSIAFLEAVVEAHFQTVHHWIPILHETRFRAKLKDATERERLTVLLHALSSVAIKYVDFGQFGMRIGDVARQIRISRKAVMMHAMESLSVENTQALIFLAFDYMGSGQVTKAWPIVGSLTRIVDYLQLTVEPDEDLQKQPLLRSLTILDKPKDWTDSEERRRLFWNVFLLDRICSVTSGWHTSLTSDDVRRRLPCGGAMWARSEPVSTPYFGIWDKSTAKIGNSISNVPKIYPSPTAIDHTSPGSNEDVDTSKLGAFAYCIEATENLSQVTLFFLQQSVDFEDRGEVKNWLTRFKELDIRLVHWKMFLPKQWRDSNVSRDVLVIKMDPNLTLAHISHNTSMILLHQHIAYPPARWKDVVKLPSSCSAETCQLAAVETAAIVQKYLRYMGGIVNSQFAFCAFVAAKVLLVPWRSREAHTLAPAFFNLLQSLKDISHKWRGYYNFEDELDSAPSQHERQKTMDLAARYAAQLQYWYSRCVNDVTYLPAGLAEILCDASLDGFVEKPADLTSTPSSHHIDHSDLNSNGQTHRRYSSGFEAYRNIGVPSPTSGTDWHAGYPPLGPPTHARLSTAYESHGAIVPPGETSPRSRLGALQYPGATASSSANAVGTNASSAALLSGLNVGNTHPHGRSNMGEEDELTAMSHILLGDQFLEMDRVITFQGTDFFSYEAARRAGLSR